MMLAELITRYAVPMRDQHAENRGPSSHRYVMLVRGILVDQRAIDVIGPHGGEGADVARHARHEPGDQRGDAQAQQARAAVARQHQRQHLVVAVQPPGVDQILRLPGASGCRLHSAAPPAPADRAESR